MYTHTQVTGILHMLDVFPFKHTFELVDFENSFFLRINFKFFFLLLPALAPPCNTRYVIVVHVVQLQFT